MASIRHVILASIVLAACVGGPGFTRRTPLPEDDDDVELPPPVAVEARIFGPLSLRTKYPEPTSSDAQRARRIHDARYLSKKILRGDVAAFLTVLDAFYPPLTQDQRTAQTVARDGMALVEKLAPSALESVIESFAFASQRYHLCVRTWISMWPCDPDFKAHATPAVPFELTEPTAGVAQLAIHDLSNAADPAWEKLPAAIAALDRARAIILDLRDAVGGDPRPLMPWLERITGGRPLRPLRAIERPASADRYVTAYAERFIPESRDRDAWAALVGPATPRANTQAKPIAIVVGRHCEAACELIARVLQTYAGATVTGGVTRSGRLSRDEPALLTLPHSKILVLFHATHYLLAPEIEAATGPTDEWTAMGTDPIDVDDTAMAYALREVTARVAGGWPRCDAFPAYRTVASLPPAVSSKLQGAAYLEQRCLDGQIRIELHSDAPRSAILRYMTGCSGSISLRHGWSGSNGVYPVDAPMGIAALPVLSQLVQGPLVQSVRIECEPSIHISTGID